VTKLRKRGAVTAVVLLAAVIEDVIVVLIATVVAAVIIILLIVAVLIYTKLLGFLVRKRTILTERLPLVGEVSANFCG
jgi:hypothetical protein